MVDYVDTFKCETCNNEASGTGHLCHPHTDTLPYECEHCGKNVEKPRHICPEMLEKIEYVCNKCGRLAVYSTGLCEPQSISGD